MIKLDNFRKYFNREAGYGEFLKISIPLILSTGIGSVQLFLNRTFLSYYSPESFAASIPAALMNFAIFSFFLGMLSYVDVFVAQYYGKGDNRAIGPIIWQSVLLAFGAAFIIFILSLFADEFFTHIGHEPAVAAEESIFFKTLALGAFPGLASACLSGFYVGRGLTKVVFFVNIVVVIVNMALDAILIFGLFGFPEWGIFGAGMASNIASCVGLAIMLFLATTKKNNEIYNTRHIKIDFKLMKRLLRFGLPNGAQFCFDMAGFGIFVVIIGTLGIEALIANNVAVGINQITIMPLVGFGMATSITVGKYLGRNSPRLAKRAVMTGVSVGGVYILIAIFCLLVLPKYLVEPLLGAGHTTILESTKDMAVFLLRILAIYYIFDLFNIVFAAAIKGAGDTAFVMKVMLAANIFVCILPAYLIVEVFNLGLIAAWSFMLLYTMTLAIMFFMRYRGGKWTRMRVIDMQVKDE
jgi:MATE family multidrug resistance protein